MMRLTPLEKFSICRKAAAVLLLSGACAGASAQTMRTFKALTDTAGIVTAPVSQAISSNHRYITGTNNDLGLFIYDLDTDEYVIGLAVDDYGADMRAVTNDGVAIGYNGPAQTYSIDGTINELEAPEGEKAIARDATEDLSIIVGNHYGESYYTTACIWRNGVLEDLPVPTSGELGFDQWGSSAMAVSEDGSVIMGYLQDDFSTYPLVVWHMQEDGSYVCDPICKDYFSKYGDVEGRPYTYFNGAGMSRNGRYVAVNVIKEDGVERMARYDLTTGELTEYEEETNTMSSAVSDDGTMVGWTLSGGYSMQQRAAAMWSVGEEMPTLVADKYPALTDMATFDYYAFNTICDITPDGRYLTGFAIDGSYDYVSYVIDLEGVAGGDGDGEGNEEGGDDETTTSISNVSAAGGDAEVARYTLDGTRISSPVKGMNIVKRADGSTVKVFVK